MPTVSAVSLPDHLDPSLLRDRIAIVIDVLRATTTIAQALDKGASSIIPVSSIDAARMIAHEHNTALLCGERSGIKPDGFHFGNSPYEYTQSHIANRDIVLTTTNGTRALQMCTDAHAIYTASITNANAIVDTLASSTRDLILVCSGTDRRPSLEDSICAGLIAEKLSSSHNLDDSARLMSHAAQGAIVSHHDLQSAIASTYHAKRLLDLGFSRDVEFAAELGTSTCVPMFDPITGEIRPVSQLNQTHG